MDSNYARCFLWQSRGKAGKFSCDFLWLHVLRESTILVSFVFMYEPLRLGIVMPTVKE